MVLNALKTLPLNYHNGPPQQLCSSPRPPWKAELGIGSICQKTPWGLQNLALWFYQRIPFVRSYLPYLFCLANSGVAKRSTVSDGFNGLLQLVVEYHQRVRLLTKTKKLWQQLHITTLQQNKQVSTNLCCFTYNFMPRNKNWQERNSAARWGGTQNPSPPWDGRRARSLVHHQWIA